MQLYCFWPLCSHSLGRVQALLAIPKGFEPADSIQQKWRVTHLDSRLIANGTIKVSGKPGDRFLLLRSPGVLTDFQGEGLRLTKTDVPGQGLMYIISVPLNAEQKSDRSAERLTDDEEQDGISLETSVVEFEAQFSYQLEDVKLLEGIEVLTGAATAQQIQFEYDEAGWDVFSSSAARIESNQNADSTSATILLGPGPANLFLKPKARDVASEETQLFVETSNLYVPGPGVVDGVHRVHVRPSQGQVGELNISVPHGLTVSAVRADGSWQFDADNGKLKLEIEPSQTQAFEFLIETQTGA